MHWTVELQENWELHMQDCWVMMCMEMITRQRPITYAIGTIEEVVNKSGESKSDPYSYPDHIFETIASRLRKASCRSVQIQLNASGRQGRDDHNERFQTQRILFASINQDVPNALSLLSDISRNLSADPS